MNDTSVVTIDTPSFLTDRLDLKPFVRSLKPHTKTAIDLLEKQMKSADEKIAQNAAKAILDYFIQANKDMNTDQLQRLIAEIKIARRHVLGAPSQDDTPTIDFDRVQDIS